MNHGFADDANSGVRPELCGDRFHASTMCAIDLGSRVDSGFNTKQSSKDMQSETNNGMHSKKSVAHSKSSVSHSKISRTTPVPNKIMHPAPRGADALALLMVDVEPSSDESLSDISGCGSKTSYPAEGEDVEMYTYTQPWGDAGPRPGETDGLTNREDFQRADSHKSLDAEARPGHGLSNSIPLDQAEEGMIKFANDPLKPPVLVTITTSYYSDSASNGLATLLDQEGIEDLLDDLSSMNFDYSSNYSNNETSPLADDGCNHEASKVIYATVGHSSSCGTVLVSIASNRHCSVECTDRATGCIASSTCSCVVDELAAEAHDRTLQVPSPGNLTRIGSTSGHLSVASSKLESVDQSVPSAGSFACDELSVGSPQEALKRDEDESSPSTCAQQLVEQASQGPSIAENSRLAGGSDEQQGVGTVPLSAEEYARKLKTELTMEELMSIMADEESDGFDDNADDLDGPEMILYAAALSQSLNENSVIPDKAERQETPGIFLKSNMECSSSQHSTKDDPLGKEPLSIAPGDASDDGNYQKKKPPARKKSEILEIEDEKYSPNRPHPALEYPLLYFILRRFPPFFERVKVLYAYRWRFTYPLQRNVPFSRSLRKAGIHSTWGELLIIMPFFASVIACLLYTAVFPSVSVTGKIARFAVIASLVFAQRNSLVTLLLGMPFDRGIFYHKLAGQVAGVTGLLHTVAFFFDPKLRRIHEADPFGGAFTGQVNISGSVFMLLIVATIVTSLPQVRRRVFEVFYYLHVVFAVGMIACAFNHTGKLVPILALLTWGVDLFIRSIVMARTRYPRKATLKLISETVIEVSFPKTSAFAYNPGQYVFLAIPELSWLQWHPFSISSSPKQRVVTLHIRKAGNWTAALFDLCKKKTEVSILLEGPYGNLSVDIVGDRRYKSIMLISGGIGITPSQSICDQLLYEKAKNRRQLRRLKFVWIERDPVLMQEVDFVRRTSSIGSVGSLELEEYMGSDGSLPLDVMDDKDEQSEHDDGTVDFDAALDHAIRNQQLAWLAKEEHAFDIASLLLSLVPPGRTTNKELDAMYDSGEISMEDEGNANATNPKKNEPNQPSNEPSTVEKRRPSLVLDDETSFAENNHSWLMESAPVVESLAQVLDMQIYLTGDAPTTGSVPYARYGRPDIKGIFLEMKQEAIDAGDRLVAVCVSAPSQVAEVCRKACIVYSDDKVRFDFHSEVMVL